MAAHSATPLAAGATVAAMSSTVTGGVGGEMSVHDQNILTKIDQLVTAMALVVAKINAYETEMATRWNS